jgi:hypothetical protein
MEAVATECPKCGCHYGYKDIGERCGDRSHMYTTTYSPPLGHPGCDGLLVAEFTFFGDQSVSCVSDSAREIRERLEAEKAGAA